MIKKILLALTCLFLTTASYAKSKTFNVTLTTDNTIYLTTYFDSESVAKVMARAKYLDSRMKSNEPLYFVLDSGGGSIWAGLELIENLRNLNRPVRTITMFAASMGFQTVNGLSTRLIQETGVLMAHKARGGFYGEFPGQLDSRYRLWLNRVTQMDKKVVKRTKGKHTLKSYRSLIENEYWCEGQECIDQGFADVLVRAKCDKSLSGFREENYRFLWNGHAIELVWTYDACPLNTGELNFQIYVDGKKLFTRPGDKTGPSNVYIQDVEEFNRKVNEMKESRINRKVSKSY